MPTRFTEADIKRKGLRIFENGKLVVSKEEGDALSKLSICEKEKSGRPKLPATDASGYNEVQQHLSELHKDLPKFSMQKIHIKPLSVNEAYTGKRFKTEAHREWSRRVGNMLPAIELPEPPYRIYLIFGFSSNASDWDNPIKAVQDCIAKAYKFNDKLIRAGVVETEIVPKGQEYFGFCIDTYIK